MVTTKFSLHFSSQQICASTTFFHNS